MCEELECGVREKSPTAVPMAGDAHTDGRETFLWSGVCRRSARPRPVARTRDARATGTKLVGSISNRPVGGEPIFDGQPRSTHAPDILTIDQRRSHDFSRSPDRPGRADIRTRLDSLRSRSIYAARAGARALPAARGHADLRHTPPHREVIRPCARAPPTWERRPTTSPERHARAPHTPGSIQPPARGARDLVGRRGTNVSAAALHHPG